MDSTRRRLVQSLAVGAAALGTGAAATAAPAEDCRAPGLGLSADRFPDVVVFTQHGQKVRFYQDLVRNRTCLLHYMSVRKDGDYPVLDNVAQVQELLGPHLGRDVSILSITSDPEHDTPEVLARCADGLGARPGWYFLTGGERAMTALRHGLFFSAAGHRDHAAAEHQDCAVGLMRYGNDAVGTWGSVPARATAAWIVERLSWVQKRSTPEGAPVRKGPPPLFI